MSHPFCLWGIWERTIGIERQSHQRSCKCNIHVAGLASENMFRVDLYKTLLSIFWSGRPDREWYAKHVEYSATAIYHVYYCVRTQFSIDVLANVNCSRIWQPVLLQPITVGSRF